MNNFNDEIKGFDDRLKQAYTEKDAEKIIEPRMEALHRDSIKKILQLVECIIKLYKDKVKILEQRIEELEKKK